MELQQERGRVLAGLKAEVEGEQEELVQPENDGHCKQLAAYHDAVERAIREAIGLNEVPAKTVEEQKKKESSLKAAVNEYNYHEFDKPHEKSPFKWPAAPTIYPDLHGLTE